MIRQILFLALMNNPFETNHSSKYEEVFSLIKKGLQSKFWCMAFHQILGNIYESGEKCCTGWIQLSEHEQHMPKKKNQSTPLDVVMSFFSYLDTLTEADGSNTPVSLLHTWTPTQVFLHPHAPARWLLISWKDSSTFWQIYIHI